MSEIIGMYMPPKEMKVVNTFILNYVNIYDLSNDDDGNGNFREVESGETLLVLAKVTSSKCESGLGYVIWDPVLKESAIVDSMLLQE